MNAHLTAAIFEDNPGTGMSPFWILSELMVMEEVVSGDNWSYKMCKAPVKSSPPTPNISTGQVPFLSPNQQCQSTEGTRPWLKPCINLARVSFSRPFLVSPSVRPGLCWKRPGGLPHTVWLYQICIDTGLSAANASTLASGMSE